MKEQLLSYAKQYFKDNNLQVHLVDDQEDNKLMNDLVNYSHLFVLGCCMDRQIKAEKAWMIPIKIIHILGDASMPYLSKITLEEYIKIFETHKLHRFTTTMATIFYDAIQLIHIKYQDNANNIWNNKPSSATVVYRFLEFNGVGIKIATMAANILARQYKIPMADYYCIDISPDVHIQRVMKRLGLVDKNANINQIIYKAREINPKFPGIIDSFLFDIGRKYCYPNNPNCENCPMNNKCIYKEGMRWVSKE